MVQRRLSRTGALARSSETRLRGHFKGLDLVDERLGMTMVTPYSDDGGWTDCIWPRWFLISTRVIGDEYIISATIILHCIE